ncbi:MAG: metallophosphoesterase, partial [Candidatus Micrarchaeaceae archaeon]
EDIIEYAKENKIKLIVHSGDVFDRINPKLSYISRLMKILYKATKDGITLIIISGNHDQPKIRGTFNPLELFDQLDNVYVFTEPGIVSIEDTDFICIPSPREWSKFAENFNTILNETLEKYKHESDMSVLVTHIQISSIIDKSTLDIEPFIVNGINPDKIPKIFNYIALGHIHTKQQINGRPEMYYSGSTSLLSFNEINTEKYFLDVEIEPKTEPVIKPIKIDLLYDLKELKIDAEKMKTEEDILNSIDYYIKNIKIENSILKIIFYNCTDIFYSIIDSSKIVSKLKQYNILGLKIELKRNENENALVNATNIDINNLLRPVMDELKDYFVAMKEPDIDKLLEMHLKIITKSD